MFCTRLCKVVICWFAINYLQWVDQWFPLFLKRSSQHSTLFSRSSSWKQDEHNNVRLQNLLWSLEHSRGHWWYTFFYFQTFQTFLQGSFLPTNMGVKVSLVEQFINFFVGLLGIVNDSKVLRKLDFIIVFSFINFSIWTKSIDVFLPIN